ncbi:MobA/MobL family protein [uncultured Oxalicibacterium sp.]|uniref:MobA/MobL family protein n=1 Tax=uncultured Oxalicibacterium sp. TaxID=1168540 RepID=UPI0025FF0B5E|nr:MobA/MobL family protein [uncultured Oxalicibacterium sp.]
MASFHHCVKSGKRGAAEEHAAYIARQGKYRHRTDLVEAGHGNMPEWAEHRPALFWRAGDKYERINGAVYREHEIALPAELTREQQQDLVKQLIDDLVGAKPYQYAIHLPDGAREDQTNIHLHLMYSDRMPDGVERSPEQTFSRYNPHHPEKGGCKKDSGGKNRIAIRDQLIATRKKCAELQNAMLEKHGHSARVDHRTLRAQGIDRDPGMHIGPRRARLVDEQGNDNTSNDE